MPKCYQEIKPLTMINTRSHGEALFIAYVLDPDLAITKCLIGIKIISIDKEGKQKERCINISVPITNIILDMPENSIQPSSF